MQVILIDHWHDIPIIVECESREQRVAIETLERKLLRGEFTEYSASAGVLAHLLVPRRVDVELDVYARHVADPLYTIGVSDQSQQT